MRSYASAVRARSYFVRGARAAQHDPDVIEQEVSHIRALAPDKEFCLKAVRVNSWNRDLSPWPAPPAFGHEGFGEGAEAALAFLLEDLIPSMKAEFALTDSGHREKLFYIGGYSLAGLFALWAVYQTDLFSGAAAASPSIWFPGFLDYMKSNPIRTEAVYLSLGDKEEKTRNPVMSQVGKAIRRGYDQLTADGCSCILEWNQGNHFQEPDLRTAKAFAWLLNRESAE